jgi:hypothetical protein
LSIFLPIFLPYFEKRGQRVLYERKTKEKSLGLYVISTYNKTTTTKKRRVGSFVCSSFFLEWTGVVNEKGKKKDGAHIAFSFAFFCYCRSSKGKRTENLSKTGFLCFVDFVKTV